MIPSFGNIQDFMDKIEQLSRLGVSTCEIVSRITKKRLATEDKVLIASQAAFLLLGTTEIFTSQKTVQFKSAIGAAVIWTAIKIYHFMSDEEKGWKDILSLFTSLDYDIRHCLGIGKNNPELSQSTREAFKNAEEIHNKISRPFFAANRVVEFANSEALETFLNNHPNLLNQPQQDNPEEK